MADEREMTYGEKAVGLTFNPSGDPKVLKLKQLYAEIIDILNTDKTRGNASTYEISGEAKRLYSIAITQAQDAQMWSVKATTFRA